MTQQAAAIEKRKATTLARYGTDFYKRIGAVGQARQRAIIAADPTWAKSRASKVFATMLARYGDDAAHAMRRAAGLKSIIGLTPGQLRKRAAMAAAAAEKKYGPNWRRLCGSYAMDGLFRKHGKFGAEKIIRVRMWKARAAQGYEQRIQNLTAGRAKFFAEFGHDYVKNFCRKGGLRNVAKHGRWLGRNIKHPNGRGVSGDLYEAVLDALHCTAQQTHEIADTVRADYGDASDRNVLRALKLLVVDGYAKRVGGHNGGYVLAESKT